MDMGPNQKIMICKKIREYSQKCLLKILQEILYNNLRLSESEIRDMWLNELRKDDTLFKEGWYSPPPYGLSILIGTDNDGEENRLNYKSLRPEQIWPRKDKILSTENGIIFAYASPVNKKSGIIGDFGVTLYFGKDKEIINHLILCYKIVHQVFEYTKPGITFDQIAKYTKDLILSYGLNNDVEVKTNPLSADNIGHTIPFIMENLTKKESEILKDENYEEIKKMISEKRIFVSSNEHQVVKKGMAFTIEPRPRVANNTKVPMASFHSICAIYKNGEKELITNFDNVFNLVGMKYME